MGGIKHTSTALQTNPPLPGLGTHVALLKALQTHSTAGAAHAHSLLSLPFAEAHLEGWLCVQPQPCLLQELSQHRRGCSLGMALQVLEKLLSYHLRVLSFYQKASVINPSPRSASSGCDLNPKDAFSY